MVDDHGVTMGATPSLEGLTRHLTFIKYYLAIIQIKELCTFVPQNAEGVDDAFDSASFTNYFLIAEVLKCIF